MDHFELLGLARQFELDVSSLSMRYRELQRQYHPDRFATASETEKRLALQKSAQINDAYQSLIDPIRRAEYLLYLNGIDIQSEQKTFRDTEFLMQQMQLRETLEDIEQRRDENQLANFNTEIEMLFQAKLSKLSQLLNANAWQDAAISVHKLKFLAKLKHEIERIEERLF